MPESIADNALPESFMDELRELESAYLQHSDPIRQSGFGGGAERWRAEREPILEAVDSDGEILDAGCANGYLVECLIRWASERGIRLTPYGVDQGSRLIALAKQRLPQFSDNFFAANAWDWVPPRRFRFVYALYDCVPEERSEEYVGRLIERMVAPGGRLIMGGYGSKSRSIPAPDMAALIRRAGFAVMGRSEGGDGPITRFAWTEGQEMPLIVEARQG